MRRRKKSGQRKLHDKGRKLRRRKVAFRQQRQRFLIVCEGEKTEPNYFRSFRAQADVKVIGIGRDTIDVVEHAHKLQQKAIQSNAGYDQVWAVFDRDDFSADKFNRAIQIARNNAIGAAYSNPSFELWFLLHFEIYRSPLSRKDCEAKLSKHLGGRYRKNQVGMREQLQAFEQQAIERAEGLCRSYKFHNPARDNPCTTVYQLVKELRKQSV